MNHKRVHMPLVKYPVLIFKPHNIEHKTDERVSHFILNVMRRGVAEPLTRGVKLAELGRNYAIKEFLNNPKYAKKTHLFFLDADTCPCEDFAIEKLLSFGKDVIAGATPIVLPKDKETAYHWSVLLKDEAGKYQNISIGGLPIGLFKADRVGGTTLLIRRRVLEKLEPPYQLSIWNKDMTDLKLSEDFYFSDKIRKAGFDIWVDPETKCHHYHTIDALRVFDLYDVMAEKINRMRKEVKWQKLTV